MPQIAIPALSPRGTEEQGMTGDANGHQETWPNLEISRNSQISDYLKIPPLSDWGSRGPGFKSRQPDSKVQVRGPGQSVSGCNIGQVEAIPEAGPGCPTPADWGTLRWSDLEQLIRSSKPEVDFIELPAPDWPIEDPNEQVGQIGLCL